MTAIVGTLQLDDDQVSGAIERQQVDPTPSVLPLPELLPR
jgi:hypothetical protein